MTTPQVTTPELPKSILAAHDERCHALYAACICAICIHHDEDHDPPHAGNGVVPATIQDPFLQRLVRKDVITAKKVGQKAKELMKDAPAVEQQLILRAESTKEHLARLFELQEGYQERLTTFLRTAAQSVGQAELTQQVSCRRASIAVKPNIDMHSELLAVDLESMIHTFDRCSPRQWGQ